MPRFEKLTKETAKERFNAGNPHIYINPIGKNPNHNSTPLFGVTINISAFRERTATFEETAEHWANILRVKVKKCEYLQYLGE